MLSCSYCENSYSFQVSLDNHIKRMHKRITEDKFQCKECSYSIDILGHFKNHKVIRHRTPARLFDNQNDLGIYQDFDPERFSFVNVHSLKYIDLLDDEFISRWRPILGKFNIINKL
jgi:hypothetical protein